MIGREFIAYFQTFDLVSTYKETPEYRSGIKADKFPLLSLQEHSTACYCQ